MASFKVLAGLALAGTLSLHRLRSSNIKSSCFSCAFLVELCAEKLGLFISYLSFMRFTMSFFIADAVAQAEVAAPPAAGWANMLLLGGLFVFMYFVIIRPQRKRAKEHEQLTSSLSKGDEVVMNSGLLGKISSVDDAYITVSAANNVDLKFQKSAVHAVLPKGTIKSL